MQHPPEIMQWCNRCRDHIGTHQIPGRPASRDTAVAPRPLGQVTGYGVVRTLSLGPLAIASRANKSHGRLAAQATNNILHGIAKRSKSEICCLAHIGKLNLRCQLPSRIPDDNIYGRVSPRWYLSDAGELCNKHAAHHRCWASHVHHRLWQLRCLA